MAAAAECIRSEMRGKLTWKGDHAKSLMDITQEQSKVVIFGDSLVANLQRYPDAWEILNKLQVTNCGIHGDRAQNVLPLCLLA